MRMQPPFSGRLPDFQKGAELTAGSGALWSGVLYKAGMFLRLWFSTVSR